MAGNIILVLLIIALIVGAYYLAVAIKKAIKKALLDEERKSMQKNIDAMYQSRKSCTINGKKFDVSGRNITVDNDKIIVDGKVLQSNLTGIVKIEWHGDLAKLECNTCEIHGAVSGNVNANTVKCNDVGGDVDANTVKCGNINGDVVANTIKKS